MKAVTTNIFIIATLLIASSDLFAIFSRYAINKTEYNEIKLIAKQVQEVCKPPDCIVVGLGRSPTSVIDYLNISNPNSALHFPSTRFREMSPVEKIEGADSLFAKRLKTHIDEFLLNKLGSKVKRIVLVDYGQSGKSILAMNIQIRHHLKRNDSKLKIRSVIFSTKKNGVDIKKLYDEHLPSLDTDSKPKFISLQPDRQTPYNYRLASGGGYDDVAKYEAYRIKDQSGPPVEKRSDARKIYLESLKKLIQEDPGTLTPGKSEEIILRQFATLKKRFSKAEKVTEISNAIKKMSSIFLGHGIYTFTPEHSSEIAKMLDVALRPHMSNSDFWKKTNDYFLINSLDSWRENGTQIRKVLAKYISHPSNFQQLFTSTDKAYIFSDVVKHLDRLKDLKPEISLLSDMYEKLVYQREDLAILKKFYKFSISKAKTASEFALFSPPVGLSGDQYQKFFAKGIKLNPTAEKASRLYQLFASPRLRIPQKIKLDLFEQIISNKMIVKSADDFVLLINNYAAQFNRVGRRHEVPPLANKIKSLFSQYNYTQAQEMQLLRIGLPEDIENMISSKTTPESCMYGILKS